MGRDADEDVVEPYYPLNTGSTGRLYGRDPETNMKPLVEVVAAPVLGKKDVFGFGHNADGSGRYHWKEDEHPAYPIGGELRRFRVDNELSIRDVASILGLGVVVVGEVERGVRQFKSDAEWARAKALLTEALRQKRGPVAAFAR